MMEGNMYDNGVQVQYAKKSVEFKNLSAFRKDETALLDELERCYYDEMFDVDSDLGNGRVRKSKSGAYTVLRKYVVGSLFERTIKESKSSQEEAPPAAATKVFDGSIPELNNNEDTSNVSYKVKDNNTGLFMTSVMETMSYVACLPVSLCSSRWRTGSWNSSLAPKKRSDYENMSRSSLTVPDINEDDNESDVEVNTEEAGLANMKVDSANPYGAIAGKNFQGGTEKGGENYQGSPEKGVDAITSESDINGMDQMPEVDQNEIRVNDRPTAFVKRAFLLINAPGKKKKFTQEQDDKIRKIQYESICELYPSLRDGIAKSRVMKANIGDQDSVSEVISAFLNGLALKAMVGVIIFNGHQDAKGLALSRDDHLSVQDLVKVATSVKDSRNVVLPHVLRVVLPHADSQCENNKLDRGDVHLVSFTK